MKFSKSPQNPERLIALLKSRGLHIENETVAKHALKYIGYYRLSGYAYPFLADKQRHLFKSGVSFEELLDCYLFDRQFRLLLSEALETIEVAIRITISDYMSRNVNPHWFLETQHFIPSYIQKKKQFSGYDIFLKRIEDNTQKSSDLFFKHYYKKYTTPYLPPSWMIFEALEFGTISVVYSNLKNHYKTAIAKEFGLSRKDLRSWLHSLSHLRNLCAHHSRVWNRSFAILPDKSGKYKNYFYNSNKVSDFLVIIQIFLNQITPQNSWKRRFEKLLQKHPLINVQYMGLPQNWMTQSLWQ